MRPTRRGLLLGAALAALPFGAAAISSAGAVPAQQAPPSPPSRGATVPRLVLTQHQPPPSLTPRLTLPPAGEHAGRAHADSAHARAALPADLTQS